MKGLLIKDIYLLKNQANFFAIVGLIGLLMLFTQDNTFFLISYMTLVFTMFTISTISYDEFENGTAFLLTLPINRKAYVMEKYVFGLLIASSTWLFAIVIAGTYTITKQPQTDMAEWFLTTIVFIFLPMIFLALTLPVQFKFGADKGRIAMFGVIGSILLVAFVIGYALKRIGINLGQVIDRLNTLGLSSFIGIAAVVCIGIYIVSYLISLQIMNKKQF